MITKCVVSKESVCLKMKIYRAFLPKGNMINREYKAHRNIRNLCWGSTVCQSISELANITMGKPINTGNISILFTNMLFGLANEFGRKNLHADYLKILERSKNIKFTKSL